MAHDLGSPGKPREVAIKKLIPGLLAVAAIAGATAAGWLLAAPGAKFGAGVVMPSLAGPAPMLITINTDRHGPHHVLKAAISGPSQQAQMVSFIVDTGASEVILPISVMQRLGFRASDLRETELQTVNGRVLAKRGVLRTLVLGDPGNQDVIRNVAAVFIDDAATGGFAFLGMNILGRYSITISDEQDQILLRRQN
jgi:clan AA aspartic protease (TIGR02281 family)